MDSRQTVMNASDRLTAGARLDVNRSPLTASASNRTFTTSSLLVYQESEPNNTYADAYARNNMNGVNDTTKTYNGQVTTTDQTDIYAFSVAKGLNTVNLRLSGSTGNLNLALYNSQGQYITGSFNGGSNESIARAGLAAGTYYAKVIKAETATSTNNYSLSVSGRESQRRVKVTITNLNDTDGDLDQDYSVLGKKIINPADFNAQIKVGTTSRYFTGPSDQDSISPNWQVVSSFAASQTAIPITISAFERDTVSAEVVDLNPSSSVDGGLSMTYDANRNSVTIAGVGERSIQYPITLAGSGNNHDAQITFKVETELV